MKKSVVLMCLFLILLSPLSAVSYHTVEVNHPVYRIIRSAELRGLIPHQSSVKPYSVQDVRSLLDIIRQGDISDGERDEIQRMENQFDYLYSKEAVTDLKEISRNGFYRLSGENTRTSIGMRGNFRTRAGFTDTDPNYDTRNGLEAYISGDLYDTFSYDMNIGVLFDHLDPNTMIISDFSIPAEGWYFALDEDARYDADDFPHKRKVNFGYAAHPEMAMQLWGDKVKLRLASVKRDWGDGRGNIQLSDSAATFPAFEFQLAPAPWFRFSSLCGSLLNFAGTYTSGRPFPTDNPFGSYDKKDFMFDNNFCSQRVEWDMTDNLTFSIYESIVWHKRFEIAYLNPFSIYMYDQNSIGDLDNMLAGVGFLWRMPNLFSLYGSMACTELNNVKKFFTWPRNVLAMQGGVDVPVPWGEFGVVNAQFTYISPFFYTHYVADEDNNPWNRKIDTAYVNKGFCLGSPLDPDTLELRASWQGGVFSGWNAKGTLRWQMKSAQYATNEKWGNDLMTPMDYDKASSYAQKQFFKHIWSHSVAVDLEASRRLENFPVEFFGGVSLALESHSSYKVKNEDPPTPTPRPEANPDINFGHETEITGDWTNEFKVYGMFGFTLYM